ncbi:MAG: hypothetical protein ABSC06_12680 [Rhodopila sp.]
MHRRDPRPQRSALLLAVATAGGHFVIMLVFPKLLHLLPRSRRLATEIFISYEDGRDVLRTVLIKCAEFRFAINHVRIDRDANFMDSREAAIDMADDEGTEEGWRAESGTVTLRMQVKGKRLVSSLIATLSSIDGVREVGTVNEDTELD